MIICAHFLKQTRQILSIQTDHFNAKNEFFSVFLWQKIASYYDDESWMIDEASLVTFTHNSWNFENNLLLHSFPFTQDNNLPQSHARGFLKNPTTPEIPRDNPERHPRDPTPHYES